MIVMHERKSLHIDHLRTFYKIFILHNVTRTHVCMDFFEYRMQVSSESYAHVNCVCVFPTATAQVNGLMELLYKM